MVPAAIPLIGDVAQGKSVGGRRGTGQATLTRPKQLGHMSRLDASTANANKGSDDAAHHPLEKCVAGHSDKHRIALTPYGDGGEMSHRARLGAHRKCPEVVYANQSVRRITHRCEIERPGDVPAAFPIQGRSDWPLNNPVLVGPRDRATARIKIRGNGFDMVHCHVGRQPSIKRSCERRVVQPRIGGKAHHLAYCVDAGICATRAGNPYRFRRHCRDRSFELGLHGSSNRLALKTRETRTVVFDGRANRSRHG